MRIAALTLISMVALAPFTGAAAQSGIDQQDVSSSTMSMPDDAPRAAPRIPVAEVSLPAPMKMVLEAAPAPIHRHSHHRRIIVQPKAKPQPQPEASTDNLPPLPPDARRYLDEMYDPNPKVRTKAVPSDGDLDRLFQQFETDMLFRKFMASQTGTEAKK